MNPDFQAHVERLLDLAVNCTDEERRIEAARSLACMVLLIE